MQSLETPRARRSRLYVEQGCFRAVVEAKVRAVRSDVRADALGTRDAAQSDQHVLEALLASR